ncbi:MFS transporter [Ferrimicrobium sp.]|uniref:MFS transporter n=1 Tax=Ferrimicrobium sp. TaxID=2926050 RepID=UPI0026132848|nr:MFS transporter [Ferrimicrobium sp.]
MEQSRRRLALAVLSGVLFLTFLDTTIVAVALAPIQSHLHAGVDELQWVIGGYAVAFAALMLVFGAIGDRYGRRRMMVAGLGLFVIGSVIAALAPSAVILIVARVVMGIGAAASEPGTLSLIRHLYPEESDRTKALGTWAAVAGFALAIGPVLGGILVGLDGWPTIFWFNCVAGVVVIVMAIRVLPESADRSIGSVDVLGSLTGPFALGVLVVGIVEGEVRGYASPIIVTCFALALLGAIGFILAEHRALNPLLRLRFLRNARFSGALMLAFSIYFSIFAIFFFVALYLEVVEGDSSYQVAGIFAAMMITMIVASIVAGRWTTQVGTRMATGFGALLAAAGIGLSDLALSGPTHPLLLAATLAIAGIGFGLVVVPVTSIALSTVPPEHSGMAAAATNTMRALGVTLSVAILGSFLNGELTGGLSSRLARLGVPPAFRQVVINAVETGGVAGHEGGAAKIYGPIVGKVIGAAYSSFHAGLSVSLIIAGSLIVLGGAVSLVTRAGHTR